MEFWLCYTVSPRGLFYGSLGQFNYSCESYDTSITEQQRKPKNNYNRNLKINNIHI